MRIARIRLSDKISRLHPRWAAAELGQAYEPEVPADEPHEGISICTLTLFSTHASSAHGVSLFRDKALKRNCSLDFTPKWRNSMTVRFILPDPS